MSINESPLWKTNQVAQALGLSVSTVKRLVDSGAIPAARTCGKHRLVCPGEVLRYALAQRLPLQEPLRVLEQATRPSGESSLGVPIDRALVEEFVAALSDGRMADVRRLFQCARGQGGNAAELADNLIQPAMAELGHAWSEGTLDVFQEHRATRVLEGVLLELNGRLQQEPGRSGDRPRPLAIGAAPEDDPYTLSGLLCELALREQGWDVINLGPNLPLGSLAKAVEAHRPRLVWITVSHLEDSRRFIEDYSRFYATASRLRSAVVLGGQGLELTVRQQICSAGFGERIGHLVEFARLLHPEPPGPGDRVHPTAGLSETSRIASPH